MYYIHNYSLIAAVRVSILRADFIQRREEGRKAVGTPLGHPGTRREEGRWLGHPGTRATYI